MNTELYNKLGIDPSLGLKDLLEELGQKELEYNERAQMTDSDKRREELLVIIKEIDNEIENVKSEIKSAESALIYDDEPEGVVAINKEESPNEKKPDKDDERIEEFKRRAQAEAVVEPVSDGQVIASGTSLAGAQNPGPPANSLQYAVLAYNKKDYSTAISVLEPLAKQNDTNAQILLAHMALKGEGYPADPNRFIYWLKKAIECGSLDAAGKLGIYYLAKGDGNGNYNSKDTKKCITEGLELLGKAASTRDISYMKNYVETVELKFNTDNDSVNQVIRSIIKKQHILKAVEFCNYLSKNISDSYEADQWQKRGYALKKGRSSDGSKPVKVRKHHGCLWWLIMIFFVFPMCISIIFYAVMFFSGEMTFDDIYKDIFGDKRSSSSSTSQNEEQPSDDNAAPAAAPPVVFGEKTIELHDIPEGYITKFENISATNESGRWYGLEDLNSAFLYQANSNHSACAEYNVDGKFELLEFRVYPYFYDKFGENVTAKILIYDGNNDEIISETIIDSEPVITTVSADIKGRKKVNISVSFDSGGLATYESYLFIKDAYLYPSAKDKKIEPKMGGELTPADLENFGSSKIELHDVPDGAFLKSWNRSNTTNDDFTVGGEIWRSAFIYKADINNTSYSDYLVDGKFKRLKFKATPYTNSHFSNNNVAKIIVRDPDKDKILYEQDVTSESGVIEASVNIKGRKRIRIAVKYVDGSMINYESYVLIKDAYLYPADKTEKKTDSDNSAVKGIEFHDLPEGSITGNKNFIMESGTHNYSPDGDDWSSAYILAASKKSPVATANVKLGGKYKTLTFKAAALRENDHFIDTELVKFSVSGGKVLYSEKLGIDPAVNEISCDVTGLDEIDFKAIAVPVDPSNHDAYLMIKDAYLT